jgi:hypothetical protein
MVNIKNVPVGVTTLRKLLLLCQKKRYRATEWCIVEKTVKTKSIPIGHTNLGKLLISVLKISTGGP